MKSVGAAVCGSLALIVAGAAGGAAPQPGELVFSSSRAPDFHNEVYVLDTQTGARRNLSRNPTADHHPTPSPDGRVIAFASDRGGRGEAVWRMSSDGRALSRLHEPLDGYIDSLEWSRDGRWIALHLDRSSSSSATYVVPATGGSARHIATGSFAVAWLTARTLVIDLPAGVTRRDVSGKTLWRRPGGLIADVSERGEVALADAGRLEIVNARGVRRTTIRGRIPALWSPDGTLLAYTHPSGGIRLLDLRNRVRVLAPRLRLAGGWAPDGRSLLAADQDTSFRPVSVALDGRTTRVGVNNGKWSRNGRLLLGAGEGGRASVWRPGSKARFLTAPPRQEPCPTYYNAFEWLDDRRVVLEFGRGGQQDTDLWVARRSGPPLRRLRRGNDWVASPDWAPDGSRVVYATGRVITHGGGCAGFGTSQLRIMSADGSGDRPLVPEDGGAQFQPRWSPDGSMVAFHRTDLSEIEEFGVFVVDVASRALRRLSEGFGEGVSWAPDGRRLTFSGKGGVWISELEHGTVTRIASGERPEWSPDGLQIAFVRGGELWTTSPDAANARRLAPVRPVGGLRWSRDGSLLAFGVRDGILLVGRDGAIRRRIPQAGGREPRFSRDGRTIAFVAPVGSYSRGGFNSPLRTEIYLASTSAGPARRLTRDFANVGAPSWR